MTFVEAAVAVLQQQGRPLHFRKLVEIAVRQNLLSHVGRTPEETMQTQLANALRRDPDRIPLVRVAPGIFGLKSYPPRSESSPAAADAEEGTEPPAEGRRKKSPAKAKTAKAKTAKAKTAKAKTAKAKTAKAKTAKAKTAKAKTAKAKATKATGGGRRSAAAEEQKAAPETPAPQAEAAAAGPEQAAPADAPLGPGELPAPGTTGAGPARRRRPLVEEAPTPGTPSPAVIAAVAGAAEPTTPAMAPVARGEEAPPKPVAAPDARAPSPARVATDAPSVAATDGAAAGRDTERQGRDGRPRHRDGQERVEGERREARPAERERRESHERERGAPEPRQDLFPADAAHEILRAQGEARPLHARQLLDMSLKRRLTRVGTPEPWRALRAAVVADARDRARNGLRPRFRTHGAGLYTSAFRHLDADLVEAERQVADRCEALRQATRTALGRSIAKLTAPGFEQLTWLLLHRLGHREMELARRHGTTAYISCTRPPLTLCVAVRHGSVSDGREAVVALRAEVQRLGLRAAMLITNGSIHESAVAEAREPGVPLSLYDGTQVAELCLLRGLGVVRAHVPVDYLDMELFAELLEG